MDLVVEQRAPGRDVLERLVRNWTFEPSAISLRTRLGRTAALLTGLRPAPSHLVLKPVVPRRRWSCYFAYLPDGRLTAAHEFTLARLCALDAGLLVICAAPSPADVPARLFDYADALCWKALSGYDFSAYSIALREVAERSGHADLLVLNDSVYGPFHDLEESLAGARWGMTGFTASAMVENHVQSYAFQVRDVTLEMLHHLRSIMPRRVAFDRAAHVIAYQETRMARVASATMSVGALWFADKAAGDPSLEAAIPLVRAGFPFVKRGLFTKARDYVDSAELRNLLEAHRHPLP